MSKLYILILTKSKYVERGARNRHQRIFRKVCTIGISVYIGNQKDEFFMIRIKLRLDFLFLYIFLIILEYIWWSLHSSFLIVGMVDKR